MKHLNEPQLVAALNEWMRRYIDHPEQYENDLTIAQRFAQDEAGDDEPSYGRVCAALLFNLTEELAGGSDALDEG